MPQDREDQADCTERNANQNVQGQKSLGRQASQGPEGDADHSKRFHATARAIVGSGSKWQQQQDEEHRRQGSAEMNRPVSESAINSFNQSTLTI